MTDATGPIRRARALERLGDETFDAFVIGGGINGAAATLALAASGANVACATRDDLAAGTSEASSNYVWGGFKYLESYEFALVAKLCASRNRLVRAFPSRLVETRFLATLDESAPHTPWFAALGAVAYAALGRGFTRWPRLRSPSWIDANEPVVDTTSARGAIEYSDFLIADNDARLVAQLHFDAIDRGAAVANYAEVVGAEWSGDHWTLDLRDRTTNDIVQASARALVNAAGPHAEAVGALASTSTEHRLVLSKGIHLIVPQIAPSRRVLAFYDDSQRLFYVIPMGHRSAVGTTDSRTDDPDEQVTDAERRDLLEQINRRLTPAAALQLDDIIAERVGVRPLVVERSGDVGDGEWLSLSRKHVVEVDRRRNVLTILGGKLTDCTNVGREVVEAVGGLGLGLAGKLPKHWFGEPARAERDAFLDAAARVGLDWRPRFEREASHAEVIWRRYGARSWDVLARVGNDRSLAASMMGLADYCEAEVRHVADAELVVHVHDFLRRRTPLVQLNRPADLAADPGVRRAAEVLRGPGGVEELDDLTAEHS